MRYRTGALLLAVTIALPGLIGLRSSAAQAQPDAPSEALLAKLPVDWHALMTLLTITPAQQKTLLAGTDEAARQAIVRTLARRPEADAFIKTKLASDPSPRVRSAIVQILGNDARWIAAPDTAATLERVLTSDPDTTVSLAALEALRRWRMRDLNALLTTRIEMAKQAGDPGRLEQLREEQDRWFSLERGNAFPSFMRTAPPVFTVTPSDRTVRVLAFGDFGNGSIAQKTLAATIGTYHRARPFTIAITLGDNFYDRGMESPNDHRWQTWFEELYGPLGITFYAALGNHDWGYPDSPAAEILYSQKSASWEMPAAFYTYTAGPAQFFALDTQSIAWSEKQIAWLDRELSRSTARWKIVYGHHPIYSGGNYEDRPDLIAKLLPILRNRADAYICGHDHNLQALQPDAGVHFYVAGGGGAGLYDLRPYERSLFASRTNGFAVIDADVSHLKVSFVDVTGATVHESTISKAATTSSRPNDR